MKKSNRGVTRREVIGGTVGVALGLAFLGGNQSQAAEAAARRSRVVLVRDRAVMDDALAVDRVALKKMLDQAMTGFTGEKSSRDAWKRLFKPEDTVGLVTTDHLNPTHEELVDAVRTALVGVGVAPERILMAQRDIDAVKACTALVAMPALKAHWLTGIGTVLKNYIMFSGKPSHYHDEDSVKLGEIWNLPFVKGKTRLVLVDALRPLCDKGPQPDPRYRWPYKGLIAGSDPVAVDTVGLRIIVNKRTAMRGEPWPLQPPPLCVEAADKTYGLGTSRWEEIELKRFGWEEDHLLA
jgi:hypothetical protein